MPATYHFNLKLACSWIKVGAVIHGGGLLPAMRLERFPRLNVWNDSKEA
jgi:hypothetical protein